MSRLVVVLALLASCERSSPQEVPVMHEKTPADTVMETLLAGREYNIPGLGTFEANVYEAYEGRNPRTGERVNVPEKRLPSFQVDDATREYIQGRGTPPTTPWVASFVERARASRFIAFGRVGAFMVIDKPAAIGRNPQSAQLVEIPKRTVFSFFASRQLVAQMNGSAPTLVDSHRLDAALAALPAARPHTLAELDAAFASLHLDYTASRLVEPAHRTADETGRTILGVDSYGDARWYLDGDRVIDVSHIGEDREIAIDQWAPEMLLVGAVCTVARDASLGEADAQRVFDRLSVGTAFKPDDLPY